MLIRLITLASLHFRTCKDATSCVTALHFHLNVRVTVITIRSKYTTSALLRSKMKSRCTNCTSFLRLTSLTCLFLVVYISEYSHITNAQNCKFPMPMSMGDKYDKCASVCQGRNFKCIADNTCLCQDCPNSEGNTFTNTFEDATCEFNQGCTRKCMDANADPDHDGNIGRGKKCEFTDDFYGSRFSVCVCTCL